jgi:hypothetical protein
MREGGGVPPALEAERGGVEVNSGSALWGSGVKVDSLRKRTVTACSEGGGAEVNGLRKRMVAAARWFVGQRQSERESMVWHVLKKHQQVLKTTITSSVARLQLEKCHHHKNSRVLRRTTMIEWFIGVFDNLLILCKFAITVLIIVAMSLDIAYHLLYVMHLKLDAVIGEP